MPLALNENERELALAALNSAMCGDYCADDNCPNCAEARLEALARVVSQAPLRVLRDKLRTTKALVADGVLHQDAAKVLSDVILKLR